MAFDYLNGKSVLVTGGTGSFGQRCIRTLLQNTGAARIVIFSRDELKQSQLQAELWQHNDRLRFFLGDVRDLERLDRAFWGVDYIIHAAALKQVPILEYNPFEAVKTNIIGTQNVISAAINQGAQKVILVSTDKAANPANLYGATKLCAERLIVSASAYGGGRTLFGAVRYGNVVGSRGSLVQVVKEQRLSGQVNLTHEEMTRFWITLDQGVQFVLQSLENMKGGETFVPKIPSMKIKEFIAALAPECSIKVTGIRPGEKLHEVLITPEEARRTRELADRYVILPDDHEWPHHAHYASCQKLPENTSFSSHTNTWWLTNDSLQQLLAQL